MEAEAIVLIRSIFAMFEIIQGMQSAFSYRQALQFPMCEIATPCICLARYNGRLAVI